MTPQEAVSELQRGINSLKSVKNRLQLVALKRVEAEFKVRIFQDGLDSSNGKIGKYSEKPFYLTDKDQLAVPSVFKPRGKGGATGPIVNRPRKGMYFEGGYKQAREEQGFESAFVNTDYTGSLRLSIQVGNLGEDLVLGFTDEERYKIALELEKRFGKRIYEVSPNEEKIAETAILRELREILSENGL